MTTIWKGRWPLLLFNWKIPEKEGVRSTQEKKKDFFFFRAVLFFVPHFAKFHSQEMFFVSVNGSVGVGTGWIDGGAS